MTAVGAAGTVPTRHVTTRQAAFIGVGAMVGAGIFSLLGTAGEVAGSAVWVVVRAGRDHRRAPGLLVRAARRPLPVGRRPARVRQPGLRRGPRRDRDRVARVRGQHHRDGDGRPVVRQLRQRQRRRRLRRRRQGVRGAARRGDDRAQRRRVHVRGPGLEPVVFIVVGILAVFAVVTIANVEPGPPRAVDVPAASATSCRAWR